MKAMVLCAGLGTRLRPITNRWPKPAIPLLGQPLFRYSLATLQRAGITEVGINTHHLQDVMTASAQSESDRIGAKLTVVHEHGEIQGTGGGIRGLSDFLKDDHFVVLNGDVLFGVDLAPIIAAHRASGAAATMVLLPMPEGEKYNAVELDLAGNVRRIAGKGPGGAGGAPLSSWHFTGVHVMSPAVFDFMAPTGAEDINRDVYVRMMERGLTIRGHRLTGDVYWSDLGTPKRYATTHQQLLFGQVAMEPFGTASPFVTTPKQSTNAFVHPSVDVSDLRVSGPAWIGEGAQIGAGVRLGASVSVGPGARIGDGAMLNRVAVLDGAEVAAGVLLEDVLVAPGGVIVPTQDPN